MSSKREGGAMILRKQPLLPYRCASDYGISAGSSIFELLWYARQKAAASALWEQGQLFEACGFREAEHQVEVLNSLPGRPFHEIVDR